MFSKSLVNLSLMAGISSVLFLACAESKLIFSPSSTIATTVETNKLTSQELETIAKAITVKVHVGDYRGSGILIARDKNLYTVLTNAHVVDKGDTREIETADGWKHHVFANIQQRSKTGNDLALIKFYSRNYYQVATFGDSTNLSQGDAVIAAGFPFDTDKLKMSEGKISLLPDKSLIGGYQIGFTNEILQGMSGGVLLNSQGELIGILGKGKGAIFDSAYTYSDGTTPTTAELEKFRNASFSIPIAKLADIAPQLTADILRVRKTQTPPREEYTGIVGQVDNIARQITVRIDNLTEKSNGSGVIIAKQGNNYYVVTAKHVLCNNLDTPECEAEGQHQIVTPDGVTHKLDYRTVQAPETWLDVAVFRFKSNNNYSVATLGKYDVGDKAVFVSGFPRINSTNKTQPKRLLTGGVVWEEERKDFLVKDAYSLKTNGKGLVYTNLSYGGMSGGAVLDAQGRLVGINTGAENELEFDEEGNYEELSLGYSLGESIQDFLGLVQKDKMDLKLEWLQVETNPAPAITEIDAATIREQLLITVKPAVDAGVTAWINYGNQLWRYGRNTEAVNAFEQAIQLEPNFDRAYYAMGLAFWSQRDYQQAVKAFSKAVEIEPDPYYYWRSLGSSHGELKNYALALSAYNAAISKNPQDFVLYVEKGNVERESENYQDALESYNKAIDLNSKHPWAYNNRGAAYYLVKQYERAISDYTKALEINPQDDKTYDNRGLAYSHLKQYDKAIANYTKAIEINPQLFQAYNNRGLAYADLQQYEKAIADYEHSIKINPSYGRAYSNRGNAYADIKEYEKAIADHNKAIEITSHPMAYLNRGQTYSDIQQYDKALSDYTKAIEINPNFALAYNNRANAYSYLKQYEKAIADYNKAIEINPNFALAYSNRGATSYQLKQYDKAIADYTKVINLNPQNDAKAYYKRGDVYFTLEQYERAIADYTTAIEINPQYATAYLKRGTTYGILNQNEKALADYDRVREIKPQEARAYLGLGTVYLGLGNWQQARKNLEQAAFLSQQQNNLQEYQLAQQILKKLSQLEAQ